MANAGVQAAEAMHYSVARNDSGGDESEAGGHESAKCDAGHAGNASGHLVHVLCSVRTPPPGTETGVAQRSGNVVSNLREHLEAAAACSSSSLSCTRDNSGSGVSPRLLFPLFSIACVVMRTRMQVSAVSLHSDWRNNSRVLAHHLNATLACRLVLHVV